MIHMRVIRDPFGLPKDDPSHPTQATERQFAIIIDDDDNDPANL